MANICKNNETEERENEGLNEHRNKTASTGKGVKVTGQREIKDGTYDDKDPP